MHGAKYTITRGATEIGCAPTAVGIAAIANVYAACRMGCGFGGAATTQEAIHAMFVSARSFSLLVDGKVY